jgi:urease accessory protein
MTTLALPAELVDAAPLPTRLWPLRDLRGRLGLDVVVREGRSYVRRQSHSGMLRVIRPHYLDGSGQPCLTMINPGGGYFGGDDYRIDVHVGEGASLLLTDQSATTVYKTPGDYCLQEVNVSLGPGAVLEYLPSQVIPYRDATYHQHTRVAMDPTASFLAAEIITPGWSPDRSLFEYDEVRLRTAISVGGRPALLDNLLVRPGSGSHEADALLFLEGMTHLGTLTAIDARIDDEVLDLVRRTLAERTADSSRPLRAGATRTEGPGLAVRVIGTHTDDIVACLHAVANLLRARWREQGPLRLRKQ